MNTPDLPPSGASASPAAPIAKASPAPDPVVQARTREATRKAVKIADTRLGLSGREKGIAIGALTALAYQLPDISQKDLASTYSTVGVKGTSLIASTLRKEFRKTPTLSSAARQRKYKEVLVATADAHAAEIPAQNSGSGPDL